MIVDLSEKVATEEVFGSHMAPFDYFGRDPAPVLVLDFL